MDTQDRVLQADHGPPGFFDSPASRHNLMALQESYEGMLDQKILPMLAQAGPEPFDSPDHLYEVYWDGTRCILFADENKIRLQNQHLRDVTFRYPEIAALRSRIWDGELVVLSGRQAIHLQAAEAVFSAAPLFHSKIRREMPATYVVFDILFLDGEKRLEIPLFRRKELVRGVAGIIRC